MALAPRLRRLHRWHALAMSAIVIASAASGLFHTWMSLTQAPPPPARPAGAVDLTAVRITPAEVAAVLAAGAATPATVTSLALRPIAGHPFWQALSEPGPPRYVDAITGHEDTAADARYAGAIASAALGGAEVRQSALLTAFDAEYISIFRLLPVYRFERDDDHGTRVYVSTITGSVARLTDDRKQLEADVFSLAHKWNFLPRPWRDVALMGAMAGIIALAVSGVVLFVLTRRRGPTAPDR